MGKHIQRYNYTEDDIGYIQLSDGNYTLVDAEDFERVSGYTWYSSKDGRGKDYTVAKNGKLGLLHHFILGKPPGRLVTDHINGNPLDNRKVNLRHCTRTENLRNRRGWNSTGYKGVKALPNGKYQINFSGGEYDTPQEAAEMFDKIAVMVYKEFARGNS